MKEQTPWSQGRRILLADLKTNPGTHPDVPEGVFRLPLSDLSIMTGVFQPRLLDGAYGLSRDHIETLSKVVTTGKHKWRPLEPMVIWWSGSRWIVIDGHHRRIAYQDAFKKLKVNPETKVPVVVFRGTLQEAVSKATSGNSHDKLPMSREDKMNAAWRLVLVGGLTLPQISKAASVSERQAGMMRSVLKTLRENPRLARDFKPKWNEGDLEALLGILGDTPWKKAQMWARGEELPEDWDADEAQKRKARQIANSISRRHGKQLIVDPDLGALALALYDRRCPEAFMKTFAWAEELSSVVREEYGIDLPKSTSDFGNELSDNNEDY